MGLRVVALVKQIPAFEVMALGDDGRLVRNGLPLEMSAYCRRAVAQGVALAAATGGTCTVVTMGPPSAEDVLREAICCGADDGVLLTDPAFAGSDTLATARTLAAALDRLGPFDLLLVGRASVDADTGQVGPQLAELLDLPFVSPVRRLELGDGDRHLRVGLELDDAWAEVTLTVPAVLGCAERLIDPCKIKDPPRWAEVDAARIRTWTAAELGDGPWGAAASPTWVGRRRELTVARLARRLDGSPEQQVAEAVELLRVRGLPARPSTGADGPVPVPARVAGGTGPVVAVLLEPGRPRIARELLGGAARLVAGRDGAVTAIATPSTTPAYTLAQWGADHVVELDGERLMAEDVARSATGWLAVHRPRIVLAPSTAWGREVASRIAAALGAGLTGDAVELELDGDDLVAWKPAFGGAIVAEVRARSDVQLATVRPGVLPLLRPRDATEPTVEHLAVTPRGRVGLLSRTVVDDLDLLANAEVVVGVGQGVDPADYRLLDPLRAVLGAELAATRKVTDRGWLPHARQVGITGLSLAPRLYVAIATSGKFNHLVGVRSAGTILAIDRDPDAPVFAASDIGLVGDWRVLVPLLTDALRAGSAR